MVGGWRDTVVGRGAAASGRHVAAAGAQGGAPRRATSLVEMRVGQSGEVIAVEAPDQAGYRRLFALGLVPGATLRLIQRFPTYVFVVGRTTIAVDAEMASGILVAPNERHIRGSRPWP